MNQLLVFFLTMENNVMPVKTAVEVEEDLKKEWEKNSRESR